MGKAQCIFKGEIYGYGAATLPVNPVMLAQFFMKNPVGTPATAAPLSAPDSSGNRERQMTDGHEYRQRGAQLAQRARQIEAPELRLVYLGLAAGYNKLARFHERRDWRARPRPAEKPAPVGGVSAAESRED
jgi:hypothetical protein